VAQHKYCGYDGFGEVALLWVHDPQNETPNVERLGLKGLLSTAQGSARHERFPGESDTMIPPPVGRAEQASLNPPSQAGNLSGWVTQGSLVPGHPWAAFNWLQAICSNILLSTFGPVPWELNVESSVFP